MVYVIGDIAALFHEQVYQFKSLTYIQYLTKCIKFSFKARQLNFEI